VIVATGNPTAAQGVEKTAHTSGQSSKGLDLVKPVLIGAIIISSIGIIVLLGNHRNK
jgi:hypothetical protein